MIISFTTENSIECFMDSEFAIKLFLVSWNFVAADGTQTTIFDYNPNKGKEGVTVRREKIRKIISRIEILYVVSIGSILFDVFSPNMRTDGAVEQILSISLFKMHCDMTTVCIYHLDDS